MTRQVRGWLVALVLAFTVIGLAANTLLEQRTIVSAVPVVAQPGPVGSTGSPPTSTAPDPTAPDPTASTASPVTTPAPGAEGTQPASPPSTDPSPNGPGPAQPEAPFDLDAVPPVPLTQMRSVLLPDTSHHIADRYLRRAGAVRVDWDQLITRGRPLPTISAGCTRSWQSAGLDARIARDTVSYLCLDELAGRGFKPQGVGGSATTEDYWVGEGPAAQRNLVITSWYASSGITRLVVLDLDQWRYNTVDLARPGGGSALRKLGSHGSGLVWAGQYLYSSSRSELLMYNSDDLLEIGGRFVLPAVSRWKVSGEGGMSSISIDRTTAPNQLRSINYAKSGTAHIQSFALEPDGALATGAGRTPGGLTLTAGFGRRGPAALHSVSSDEIAGSSFQGVASSGAYGFANSSSMRLNGRKGDTAVVTKNGREVAKYRMPHGNGQSIYIDYTRDRFVSVTEAGRQFLYQVPLDELTR